MKWAPSHTLGSWWTAAAGRDGIWGGLDAVALAQFGIGLSVVVACPLAHRCMYDSRACRTAEQVRGVGGSSADGRRPLHGLEAQFPHHTNAGSSIGGVISWASQYDVAP